MGDHRLPRRPAAHRGPDPGIAWRRRRHRAVRGVRRPHPRDGQRERAQGDSGWPAWGQREPRGRVQRSARDVSEERPLARARYVKRARVLPPGPRFPTRPTRLAGERSEPAYFGRYVVRATSAYGTGLTVTRISVCLWRSTVDFFVPPFSSPHTSVSSSPIWTSGSTTPSDSIDRSL